MKLTNHHKSVATKIILFVLTAILFGGAIIGSQLLRNNPAILTVIESFGYVGVFVAAVVSGLSVAAPIPAATLTPLFTAAGLTVPAIIFFLALGTLVADTIGYAIGRLGRSVIPSDHPRVQQFTERIANQHPAFIMLFVTGYAALIPLPNELILIPLALCGVSWRRLIIPLLVGALIIQTLLVTGVSLLPTFI